jgi:hypothetical protein
MMAALFRRTDVLRRGRPVVILPLPVLFVSQRLGGKMSTSAVENLIISSIHGAFIKYPEGDGGPNLDYEWIAPDQSAHIAKAILLDLAANGYAIVKQSP